jgi:hypothetical protein
MAIARIRSRPGSRAEDGSGAEDELDNFKLMFHQYAMKLQKRATMFSFLLVPAEQSHRPGLCGRF